MTTQQDHDHLLFDQLWETAQIEPLFQKLCEIHRAMIRLESHFEQHLQRVDLEKQASARNLIHYLSLRSQDVRPVQQQLVSKGLSSLGRCESYVLNNVETVLLAINRITNSWTDQLPELVGNVTAKEGAEKLAQNTQDLLGPLPESHDVLIMVTIPSEAVSNPALIRDLLGAGMNCARINCAHDDAVAWKIMIDHIRQAEKELGKVCKVAMDLGGPKIRTGPIELGPKVRKWSPLRDSFGNVTAPARIWLHAKDQTTAPPSTTNVCLPVESLDLSEVLEGDSFTFADTRNRTRKLQVVEVSETGCIVECDRSSYLIPGIPVQHRDQSGTKKSSTQISDIPGQEQPLVFYKGDRVKITTSDVLGRPAKYTIKGHLLEPASIGCTLPELFQSVQPGERILFDDGKIEGVIQEVEADHLFVEITRARPTGEKLRADKGINLPESDLKLNALTEKDLCDLEFVVKHADIVSLSFVRNPEDVKQLQTELEKHGRTDLGIVLKIENQQAVKRLPLLLLEAMHSPRCGVMIARGDLAVECGFERTAEVQEEILWMCEAAHIPVIWATQVLESLAKKGLPSRGEITDAAMGVRAECVMLNKGPHIVSTVQTLRDILGRMQEHQTKKRPMLRKLQLAYDVLPVDAE